MSAAQAERVRGDLADLVPGGWSECDDATDTVDFELWLAVADVTAPERLRHELARRGVVAEVASVPQDDAWRHELRRFHQPIEIAGRLRVRPPWIDRAGHLIDIVIDPGMAFGTGQHATTRGCLEFLLDAPRGSLLDVGCGSGVLSIAARKLGYDPVVAIDIDPLAVDATRRNARDNRVDLDVRAADACRDPLPECDVVIANVTANHVAALAEMITNRPARVILSGFRPDEHDAAIGPWRRHGYRETRRTGDQNWTAVALTRA